MNMGCSPLLQLALSYFLQRELICYITQCAGGYGETELHWLSGANVNESRQEPQTKYFM